MRHYVDTVQNSLGVALQGVSVRVNVAGGGLATIYSDDGITTTANPLTTDVNGSYGFYVADGRYDLVFSGTGLVSRTISDIEIADLTQAQAGDSTWVVGALKSGSTNPATAGVIQLASADSIDWRNNANNANIALSKNSSDQFSFGSLVLPAVADTVVARNTADSLTNKTLPVANSGNNISLLNLQTGAAALTGNSGDQTYYTYTLPANVMQAGKGIRVTAIAQHTTGNVSTVFRLSFGGTFTTGLVMGASANAIVKSVYEIFNANGFTNVQALTTLVADTGVTTTKAFYDTAAVSTTSSVVINVTFKVANTDQWTPKLFFVELIA